MGAQLGGGSFNDINMTPLIDIVLVVLIIMMVNIPIQVERMGVKLPSEIKTNQPKKDNKSEQLVVMLYEDGSLALNRRLMDEDVIAYELGRRLRPKEKKIVFIDAFPTSEYGRVVDLMDLAKEAGAEKVAFARLKEEGPAEATSVDPGARPKGVILGSPTTVGALDAVKADKAFEPMMPVAKQCYFTQLAATPGLTGRLIFQVDVGPTGEIMDARVVSNTTEDEALEACILEKVPGMGFPALGEQLTARVQYPLVFSPGGAASAAPTPASP